MEDINLIINELLYRSKNEKVAAIEDKTGGVNSNVYKVITENNNEYFVKNYIAKKGDSRKKMLTEYFGERFIWGNEVRSIPEPICSDEKNNIAVYEYLHGKKLESHQIKLDDVNMAADFYIKLHSLVKHRNAEKQPIASEACSNIQEYIKCVDDRVSKLQNIKDSKAHIIDMKKHVTVDLATFLNEIKKYIKNKANESGVDIKKPLKREEQTLSQSDVGFHNIIKTEEGKLYFIDFEYYGWDDPAKLISDFYLSPDHQVPAEYREVFFNKMKETYGEKHISLKRLPFVYLILAIKWCLIIINCYINRSDLDEGICMKQLEKSKEKLKSIKDEFDKKVFPISLNLS